MKTLEDIVKGKSYKEKILLYKRIVNGELRLKDPSPPSDYLDYLLRLDYSLWLWIGVVWTFSTFILVILGSDYALIRYTRIVTGIVTVLFLPGYATIESLYLKDEMGDLEKLALSMGLSLAVVPLIGLVLNYTPWGIRLLPVTVSVVLYIITLLFVASYRKYSLINKSNNTL